MATITAEQATAALINKVGQIVALNQLSSKCIVMTVPDYWSQHERGALLRAATIAK